MRNRSMLLAAALAAAPGAGAVALPPLAVSADGRRIERADGERFFWTADTAWELFRLDPDEVETYMADRAARGFNVIVGPKLLAGPGAPNWRGDVNPDPAAPDPDFFEHLDHIVDAAGAAGLYIAPVLAWGTDADLFTPETAAAWGAFVGARWRDRPHVAVYHVAGEFNHPAPNVATWSAVAAGLEAGLDGAPALITAHPRWHGGPGVQSTSGAFADSAWLDYHTIQSSLYGDCSNDPSHPRYFSAHNWLLVEHDRAVDPARPTLDGEATYEQMPVPPPPECDPGMNPSRWPDRGVRRRAYWSVFAGGFGHTYGANGVVQSHQLDEPNPVWAPLHDWTVAMTYPGAAQMGHLRRLMESRPLAARVAAPEAILAGATDDVPDHPHATRDETGAWLMAYLPQPGQPVTIDGALLAGATVRAWWFDPTTGDAALIGALPAAPAHAFTAPDDGHDHVLVLDDASRAYAPPGTAHPGDANDDAIVNVADLVAVILAWDTADADADVNGDGMVGVGDLVLVILNWSA